MFRLLLWFGRGRRCQAGGGKQGKAAAADSLCANVLLKRPHGSFVSGRRQGQTKLILALHEITAGNTNSNTDSSRPAV